MKKALWIISFLPLIITAAVLQFMPENIPVHYTIAGEVDRWGSKYEMLVLPVVLILLAVLWEVIISVNKKKVLKAGEDKQRAEAASNIKVLKIFSVATAAIFGIMQCFLLCKAYTAANAGIENLNLSLTNISCALLGIVFLVLGDFLPKTRINRIIGVRVSWSMYNDNTWRKSNRFGGIALMLAGVLTVVTSVLVNDIAALIMMMVYLAAAVIITLVYARKVYKEEKAKEN